MFVDVVEKKLFSVHTVSENFSLKKEPKGASKLLSHDNDDI